MKKKAYEWVLTMSNEDCFYLTEKQYEFYKENQGNGKIFFDTFEVNPSFVIGARKQEADHIKSMYPCRECNSNGIIIMKKRPDGSFPICPKCEGTGIFL